MSRSFHEDLAYMEMHPCECGDQTVNTRSGETVATTKGLARSYWWTCPTCRKPRRFDFFTPKDRRAASTQPYGEGRSAILDPGQWLLLGERYASIAADRSKSREDRRESRWLAPAAIQETLTFLPPETDEVPTSAFTSEAGRLVLNARPDAFRRDSLVHRATLYTKGKILPPVQPHAAATCASPRSVET